jgi:hypothetical protein
MDLGGVVAMIVIPGLLLLYLGLWVYTIWDVVKANGYQQGNKALWLALLLVAPLLGVMIYHAVGREKV